MGKGEGAQARGHGFYGSGDTPTARGYRHNVEERWDDATPKQREDYFMSRYGELPPGWDQITKLEAERARLEDLLYSPASPDGTRRIKPHWQMSDPAAEKSALHELSNVNGAIQLVDEQRQADWDGQRQPEGRQPPLDPSQIGRGGGRRVAWPPRLAIPTRGTCTCTRRCSCITTGC